MLQTGTSYLHASMPILSTAEPEYTMAVSALMSLQSNTLAHKRISTLRLCITGQAVSSISLAEFHYCLFCNLLYWTTTLAPLFINRWSESLLGYLLALTHS